MKLSLFVPKFLKGIESSPIKMGNATISSRLVVD